MAREEKEEMAHNLDFYPGGIRMESGAILPDKSGKK